MVGSTDTGTDGVFKRPYLLALNVALVEKGGRHWADASWAKDLLRHLEYLPDLTLFCPIEQRDVPPGWKELPADRLKVVGYPAPENGRQFVRQLPSIGSRLWKETSKADVVHSGVAGWPVPLGWLSTPMARLQRKKIVLIVESAFWRALPGSKAGTLQRLRSATWELIARACLRQANYAAYTQPDYRRTLPSPRADGGVLIQASWINATDCLTDADAIADWQIKAAATPRFLFASRMIGAKGTAILAEAIDLLAARDANLRIDILGDGPQLGDFTKSLTSQWALEHVRRLDPIPYDAHFLTMLRNYHAILVPSLSDEQPRIVYDAYSQGVPAIASALPGLRACIEDGVTGRLVPPADAAALAEAMLHAVPQSLMKFGLSSLAVARNSTHEKLHDDRLSALNRLFERP